MPSPAFCSSACLIILLLNCRSNNAQSGPDDMLQPDTMMRRSFTTGNILFMLQVEAAAAREELKSARKDLLQARSEGASLRALYDIANAKALDQNTKADQQISVLSSQLGEAKALLVEMVPLAELKHARQDIAALEVSWHLAAARPTGSWQTRGKASSGPI